MNLASWIQRVGAFLIDWFSAAVFPIIGYAIDGPRVDVANGTQTGGGALYYLISLVGLVVWGYNRWYLQGGTGQSWGKKALGLKLIGEAGGQPIGAAMAFVRDIAHFVDGIPCLIGYLFPLWDAKRQTFADKILKTVVTSS